MGVPRSKRRPARRDLPRARSWGAPRGGREQSSEGNRPALACRLGGERSPVYGAGCSPALRREAGSARLPRCSGRAVQRRRAETSGEEERAPRHCQRHERDGFTAGTSQPRKSNAEHRRHNGRPRTIGRRAQRGVPIARKGVRYLRRCMTAGDDPDAKPVRGTPRAERHAAAVVALHLSLGTSMAVGSITTDANERTTPPGGGREARSFALHHQAVGRTPRRSAFPRMRE